MNSINEWLDHLRRGGRLIATLSLILLAYEASPSTPQTPFKLLVNTAEEVAIVEITSGDQLLDSAICGSRYKARVIKQYKGKSRAVLAFGSRDGLIVGGKYFIVLDDKDTYIRSHHGAVDSSTCKTSLTERMIGVEFGAMLIDDPSEFDYATEAVLVPSLSIRLPRGTQCTQATSVDDFNDALDAVWIKIPEMERITLESQNASKNGQDIYLGSRECSPPPAKLMGNFSAAPALWRLIDLLEKRMPLTRHTFERSLGVSMTLAKRTEGFSEWKGAPANIRYDLGISSSSARTKQVNESEQIQAAKINLIGECITPSEIESYFGVISSKDQILTNPQEGSTTYRYHRDWGELDFGFENIAPGCLAHVHFQP